MSGYLLERRTNGGGWMAQPLAGPVATSVAQSLTFGSTYQYVVKATDGVGHTTGWAYGPTFEPRLSQEASSLVSYGGSWTAIGNAYASGSRLRYSTAAGASATFRFNGADVAWVAYRGPTRGSAAVYVDGVRKATVDLYSPTFTPGQLVFATGWSTSGSHTVRIVNLGIAGRPRIDVDAFVRLTRP